MAALKTIRELLRTFLKDQSESSYLILAFGVAMIFGLAGLATDMGYAYMLRQRLQTAADSAALAASTSLSNSSAVVSTAIAYAPKNMPPETHGMAEAEDVLKPVKRSSAMRANEVMLKNGGRNG